MKYFNLPDGSQIAVDDDVTLEEATRRARRKFPELYMTPEEEAKGGAWRNAMAGAEENVKGFVAGIKSLVGDKAELRGDLNEQAIESSKTRTTGFGDVGDAFKEGIGKGVGKSVDLVTENLGRSLGFMGPALATGAVAARGLAMVPPLAPVAGPVAAGLTALQMMQAYAGQNLGRQQQEARAKGKDADLNVGAAQAAAAGQAALDLTGLLGVAGRMGAKLVPGVTKEMLAKLGTRTVAQQLAKDAEQTLAGAAFRGVGRGLLFEMPTEAAQQILERGQAGLGWDPLDPEVLEAGALGGLMGGAMGPVAGVAERSSARSQLDAQTRAQAAEKSRLTLEAQRAEEEAFRANPEQVVALDDEIRKLKEEQAGVIAQRKALKKDKASDEYKAATERLRELDKLIGTGKTRLKGLDITRMREDLRVKDMSPMDVFKERLADTYKPKEKAGKYASVEEQLLDEKTAKELPETEAPPVGYGPAAEAFIRNLPDEQRFQFESGAATADELNPQEVLPFLLQNPQHAQNVLSGKEAYPGVDPRSKTQQEMNRKALRDALVAERRSQTEAINQQEEALGAGRALDAQQTLDIGKAEQAQQFVEEAGPVLVYGEKAPEITDALSKNILPKAVGLIKGQKEDIDFNDFENASKVLAAVNEKLSTAQRVLQKKAAQGVTPEAEKAAALLQELQLIKSRAQSVLDDPRTQEDAAKKAAIGQREAIVSSLKEQEKATRAADEAARAVANRAGKRGERLEGVNLITSEKLSDMAEEIYNGEAAYTDKELAALRTKLVYNIAREVTQKRKAAGMPDAPRELQMQLVTIDGRLRELLKTAQDNSPQAERETTTKYVGAQERAGKLIRGAKEVTETRKRMPRAEFSTLVSKYLTEIDRIQQGMLAANIAQRGKMRQGAYELQPRAEQPTVFDRPTTLPLVDETAEDRAKRNPDTAPRDRLINEIATTQGMTEMPPGAARALEAVRRLAVDNKGSKELFDRARTLIRELEAGRDPRPAIQALTQRLFEEQRARGGDATQDLFSREQLPPSVTAGDATPSAANRPQQQGQETRARQFLRGMSQDKGATPGALEKKEAKATMKENVAFKKALDAAFEDVRPLAQKAKTSTSALAAAGGTEALENAALAQRSITARLTELQKAIDTATVSKSSINRIAEAINKVVDLDPNVETITVLANVADVAIDADTTLNSRILRDTLNEERRVAGQAVAEELPLERGMSLRDMSAAQRERISDKTLRDAATRLNGALAGIASTRLAPPEPVEVVTQNKENKTSEPRPEYYKKLPVKRKRGRPSEAQLKAEAEAEEANREQKGVETATFTPRETKPVNKAPVPLDELDLTGQELAAAVAEEETKTYEVKKVKPQVEYVRLFKRIQKLQKAKTLTAKQEAELRNAKRDFATLRQTLNPDLIRSWENEGIVPKVGITERSRRARDERIRAAKVGDVTDVTPSKYVAENIANMRREKTPDAEARLRTDKQEGVISDTEYEAVSSTQPIGVQFVWDPNDSPRLVDAAERMGLDLNDVLGVTFPDGSIIVVGKNHSTQLELEATVAHEQGHERTNSYLGPEGYAKLAKGTSTLDILGIGKDLGIEKVVRDAMDMAEDVADKKQKGLSEIMARIAEGIPAENFTGRVKRFIKEWLGAVRNWLRENGFMELPKLNDADLYYTLSKARDSGVPVRPSGNVEPDFRKKKADDWTPLKERTFAPAPTISERMRANAGSNFRMQFIDRWDPLIQLVRQKYDLAKDTVEKAAAVQMHYYARWADRVANLMAVALSKGVPTLQKVTNRDGTTNWKLAASDISFGDVIKKLGKQDPENFATWMMAKRAKRVGYDVIYGDDTAELRRMAQDRIEAGNKIPEFAEAEKAYIDYNKKLVQLLMDSGFVNEAFADKMTQPEDYIPAYRPKGDDLYLVYQSGTIKIGNVREQPDLARLRGSENRIMPFPESAIVNTKTLIKHAMTNLAAKEAAYTLDSLGLGKLHDGLVDEKGETKRRNVIHFKEKGKDKSFILNFDMPGRRAGVNTDDISPDMLVTGLEGVSTNIPGFIRMMQPFSRALRYSVTRFPAYAARQLMRDPMAAWLVTGSKFNPITDTLGRVVQTLTGKDATANRLQDEGVVGGLIYEGDNESIKRLLKQFGSGDPNAFVKLMKAADDLAVDADAVTRANIYDAQIADGKSELEALIAAVDSMNFNTHGTSRSLYLLNMTVPFLRAQINALDAIYKSFTGRMSMADKLKTRNMLFQRGMMISAVTTMYALAAEDEDWYQDATEYERLNNFFIKLPNVEEPFRVPIPFELGLLFKAVPEAAINAARGTEETGEALSALKELLLNQVPNPIPQAGKPLVEHFLNGGFFTGRPIESASMQRLPMEERFSTRTPEIIKQLSPQFEILGKEMGLSPLQVEHLVRGYFGSLGIAVANIVDASLGLGRSDIEKPTAKMSENPFVGSLFQPIKGQNIIQKAYADAEKFGQQAKSLKNAEDTGDMEVLAKFANDPKKILYADMDSAGRAFKTEMASLKKEENTIRNSNMTPEEKRALLDSIQQLRRAAAQEMYAQSKALKEAIQSAGR